MRMNNAVMARCTSDPCEAGRTVSAEYRAVTRHEKTWQRLQSRFGDRNFEFADLRDLLLAIGFDERVRGGHHIFTRDGIPEIVDLQPAGHLAKPYQVRQVRNLVLKYDLMGERRDG